MFCAGCGKAVEARGFCASCGRAVTPDAPNLPATERVLCEDLPEAASPMRVVVSVIAGVVILVTGIIVARSMNGLGEPEHAHTAQATSSTPSDSVEIQGVTTKRTEVEALVRAMIARQAIASIRPDRDEAQVNPAFWDYADLNGKRGLVIVIAQYCKIQDPSTGGAVTIKSSRSGRKVAEYSALSGVTIQGED